MNRLHGQRHALCWPSARLQPDQPGPSQDPRLNETPPPPLIPRWFFLRIAASSDPRFAGVQPMSGPTGLIFALKPKFTTTISNTAYPIAVGDDALYGNAGNDDVAGDVLALCEGLDRPPLVIGASLGGSAALIAQRHRTDQLYRGLVLVDITPTVDIAGARRAIDTASNARAIGPLLPAQIHALAAQSMKLFANRATMHKRQMRHVEHILHHPRPMRSPVWRQT